MAKSLGSLSPIPSSPKACDPSRRIGLMEIYETNYQCLLALCPRLLAPDLETCGYRGETLPGMPDLKLTFHDQTRHTATFNLTCRWSEEKGNGYLPDVRVRLYRDSRQAELLGREGVMRFPSKAPERGFQEEWLNRRHFGNRFLLNWLRYCLRRGYHLALDLESDS